VRNPALGVDEHQSHAPERRYSAYGAPALAARAHSMNSTQPIDLIALEQVPPGELAALAADARALQRSAQAGVTQPLLRGRKLGILVADGEAGKEDIELFDRAAIELGAQVAHIRPHLTELSEPEEVEQTAHVLGRLYDGVVCQGIPPAVVRRLSAEAGIPVYDGIASSSGPLARATASLDNAIPLADQRRFLLQALLVSTMA